MPGEDPPQKGANHGFSQHPSQCVSVHVFQELVVPAEGGGMGAQGGADLKGTYTEALSRLP